MRRAVASKCVPPVLKRNQPFPYGVGVTAGQALSAPLAVADRAMR